MRLPPNSGANSHRISTARLERTARLDIAGERKQLLRMARNKRYDRDGQLAGFHRPERRLLDHAGAVAGAAIFSFSSVQVLRTSAVISVTFSI